MVIRNRPVHLRSLLITGLLDQGFPLCKIGQTRYAGVNVSRYRMTGERGEVTCLHCLKCMRKESTNGRTES